MDMEMKVGRKLLVIAAHFPPVKSPAADHALHLCEHLGRRGFQIDVLTTKGSIQAGPHGMRIHPIMREWSWAELPRFVKFLRRCSPDTVLLMYIGWIYNEHPMVTYAPTIVKRLLPDVTFVTQFDNAYGANPAKTSLLARAFRKGIGQWAGSRHVDWSFGTLLRDSDRIIVLSDRHRAALASCHPGVSSKSVLIPPPPVMRIDSTQNDVARQLRREGLGVTSDDVLIAYFGYIYPGKGVETLLQAFQRMNPAGRRVRLILVGGTAASQYLRIVGGPSSSAYLQSLYDLCKELGIQDRVTWTGKYAWDSYEGSRYLQAADICVLPFDGGVYLNNSSFAAAAAHGLPVITTQGSLVESPFLQNENVLLCPPKAPDALAAAMERLIVDPALRKCLSSGARELAQEWFTWDKAIERIIVTLNAARGDNASIAVGDDHASKAKNPSAEQLVSEKHSCL